jgi:hypothetical protein
MKILLLLPAGENNDEYLNNNGKFILLAERFNFKSGEGKVD